LPPGLLALKNAFLPPKGRQPSKGLFDRLGGGIEKCLYAAKKAAAFKRAV